MLCGRHLPRVLAAEELPLGLLLIPHDGPERGMDALRLPDWRPRASCLLCLLDCEAETTRRPMMCQERMSLIHI
eukprot:9515580-Alexandrium_andersonii.AAC.1